MARLHGGAQELVLGAAQEGGHGVRFLAPARVVMAAEQAEEGVHLATPPAAQRLLGVVALVTRLGGLPDAPLLQIGRAFFLVFSFISIP